LLPAGNICYKEALLAVESIENAVDELLAAHAGPVPDFRLRVIAGPQPPCDASDDDNLPGFYRAELSLSAALPEALNRKLIDAAAKRGLPSLHLRKIERTNG
jgi:hypothetical protein